MDIIQHQSKRRNSQARKRIRNKRNNQHQVESQRVDGPSKHLNSFIREHGTAIHDYAYSLAQNGVDAEDLVQEALGRVLKHVEYLERRRHLRPLVFTIIKNCFIDSHRRKKAHRTIALDRRPEDWAWNHRGLRISPNCGILNELIRIESIATLRLALRRLKPRYRDVITRCDLRGQMYQQAADQLGIPIGTVRSSVSRARIALRQSIESIEGG